AGMRGRPWPRDGTARTRSPRQEQRRRRAAGVREEGQRVDVAEPPALEPDAEVEAGVAAWRAARHDAEAPALADAAASPPRDPLERGVAHPPAAARHADRAGAGDVAREAHHPTAR